MALNAVHTHTHTLVSLAMSQKSNIQKDAKNYLSFIVSNLYRNCQENRERPYVKLSIL